MGVVQVRAIIASGRDGWHFKLFELNELEQKQYEHGDQKLRTFCGGFENQGEATAGAREMCMRIRAVPVVRM